MLLQRLEADADHIVSLPPPMYDMRPVKWIIDLAADGTYLGIVSTAQEGDSSDRAKPRLVPYVKRTSGIRPILLADTPAYTFGMAQDDARAAAKHEAYSALVTACADATGAASVQAVTHFLAGPLPVLPDDMDPSDLITFRVGREFPIDLPSVRAFWRETVEGWGSKRRGARGRVPCVWPQSSHTDDATGAYQGHSAGPVILGRRWSARTTRSLNRMDSNAPTLVASARSAANGLARPSTSC